MRQTLKFAGVVMAVLFVWGQFISTIHADSNLIKNGAFEQGLEHWRVGLKAPSETTPGDAKEPPPIAITWEKNDTAVNSKGALRVTIARDIPAGKYWSTYAGAVAETVPVEFDSPVKLRFFAKLLSGGPYLCVGRQAGGSTYATVRLSPQWQEYEMAFQVAHETAYVVFTLSATEASDGRQQPVVPGEFLLDEITMTGTPVPPPPVIPPNASRDPGYVHADDFPSLQDAVDSLPRGGTVVLGPRTYRLKKPLDLTGRLTANPSATWPKAMGMLRLVGAGRLKSVLVAEYEEGPVIDLTASALCTIESLGIKGPVGILVSRDSGAGGAHGHTFRDLLIEASVCGIYLVAAEECRIWDCRVYVNRENGIGIYFTPLNRLKVRSVNPRQIPFTKGSSCTDLRIFGGVVGYHPKGGVGVRVDGGSDSDVLVAGMYMAGGDGFAAFYLDGVEACVSNVHIQDIRLEFGRYGIYAKGVCRHITVQGGAWHSEREFIYCEGGQVGFNEGKGVAENWTVFADTWPFVSSGYRGSDVNPPLQPDEQGYRALTRFARLVNSYIRIGGALYARIEQGKGRYESLLRYVQVEEESIGNVIEVPHSDNVRFNGKVTATSVRAFNDDGVQRIYLGAGGSIGVYNLTPMDVTKFPKPVKGDVALDNGTNSPNGLPSLAIYDGKQWLLGSFAPKP